MEETETLFDQETIKAQLKEGTCQVTFNKVDGSVRIMKCTLNVDLIPEKSNEEGEKRIKTVNEDVQAVYDVDAQGWRSFRWNSLTDFSQI
jgi:hypothetical protein